MAQNQNSEIYDIFGSVLTYPDEHFDAMLQYCEKALNDADPQLGRKFTQSLEGIRQLSQQKREEMYSRTFDLSPKCTLELGWHLFGETYDRGTFLVWMRQQIRKFSLTETTDLPDHARHVFAVLGRMEAQKADEFSQACVLPAMETIRVGMKTMDSPYESLLVIICDWLKSRHGVSPIEEISLPILNQQHEDLLQQESL